MLAILKPFTSHERGGGYTYDRIHIPLLLKGAINRSVFAGHMRFLGNEIGWNGGPNGWADTYYLSFLGIVCFRIENTKGGKLKSCQPGITVHWMKITLTAAIRSARRW